MGNNIAFWKYSRVVYGGDDIVGIKWYCSVLCVRVIGELMIQQSAVIIRVCCKQQQRP